MGDTDTETPLVTTTTTVTVNLPALAEALWALRERIDAAPQRHDNSILAELAELESGAIMRAWHVVSRLVGVEKYPTLYSSDNDYFQAVEE